MLATRTRFRLRGEWLAAAAFLGATLLVGTLVIRELRLAPLTFATASRPSSTSEAVPPEAVSIPALMLGAASELRVGDRAGEATKQLASTVVLLRTVREVGPLGPREVRTYQLGTTRFILVIEPFERNGAPRVAAIYLQ